MSIGISHDIRVPMRRLYDAATLATDGLTDVDIAVILRQWGEDDRETAVRLALRRAVLLAVRRTHGTDQGHDDHWRYYARKGARP
jgi:hypothetical protein